MNAKEGIKNVVDNDMHAKLSKIVNKLANKIAFKPKVPNQVWVPKNTQSVCGCRAQAKKRRSSGFCTMDVLGT